MDDQDAWQRPGMVDGFTADDFSRGKLTAIREHAAGLNDCGLLLINEHECVSDIMERCDKLISQHG